MKGMTVISGKTEVRPVVGLGSLSIGKVVTRSELANLGCNLALIVAAGRKRISGSLCMRVLHEHCTGSQTWGRSE